MPYRQPAERPPEPPEPSPSPATQKVEPVREEPTIMWVSDAKGRARWERERRAPLITQVVYAAIVVAVILLFVAELRPR